MVGENFKRFHYMKQNQKAQVKVNKITEQKIQYEIKQLQDKRDSLYDNDNITDEELKILIKPINEKIESLINSMY